MSEEVTYENKESRAGYKDLWEEALQRVKDLEHKVSDKEREMGYLHQQVIYLNSTAERLWLLVLADNSLVDPGLMVGPSASELEHSVGALKSAMDSLKEMAAKK